MLRHGLLWNLQLGHLDADAYSENRGRVPAMLAAIDIFFRTYIATVLTIYIATGAAILIAIAVAAVAFAKRYVKYRGKRVITCPETNCHEVVELDAPLAAISSLLEKPELQLTSCTRWPERQECGQQCLREIENSPFGCAIRAMLDNWYKGKECIYCHRVFDEILWFDHKPALQSPDGHIVDWKGIRPEAIPDVLQTHQPVCWNCSIVENFRIEHPDLVTDRHR
jgi:hypothetical protein